MENVRRISLVGGGHRRTRSGVLIFNVVGGGVQSAGDVPAVVPPVKHKSNDPTLDLHVTANRNGHPNHNEQLLPPDELAVQFYYYASRSEEGKETEYWR
jgi:hypothetical protein